MAANRKAFVAGNRKAMESDAWPMRPERILADLRAALPRDALICTDVGWNKNGVGQQFPIYTPGTIFTPGGFATMGFGSPAALGAKIACPDRVVVALVGDGGFGQNPAALATAFEEDIAVIWVIMNNHAFGTIAGLETAHYGTTFGTVFEKNGKTWSPDYAAIARAYGIDGVKVASADEFKPALEKAIKSKRPCRHRRLHEERAGADGGALEHHGHLLARQEGPPRRHRTAECDAQTILSHRRTGGRTMKHDYSLAHLTALSLTPPQLVDVAARTGYRYVGLRMTRVTPDEVLYDLARDRALMKETKARARRHRRRGARRRARSAWIRRSSRSDFLAELDATAELGARAHHRAAARIPTASATIERFARLCDLAKRASASS